MQVTFRGRPSKGCNKCRQRKVKCDEGQPICERCTKGGFECTYRDEFDLLLRNQTTETAEKAKRKWRSRAKKLEERTSSSHASPSTSSSSDPCDSPASRTTDCVPECSPPVDLDQSIYDLATKRFLFDFVIPGGSQVPKTGFASFVLRIVDDMKPGTCIYHAFRATSLANFAGRSKSTHAAEMASKEYGKTIKLLGSYVSRPESLPPLQTLSSICLLSAYEILATPYLTHGGSWQAHVNGSVALLNSLYSGGASGLEQLTELFMHIIIQMLINCMGFGNRPSIPLSTVDAFVRPKTMSYQVLSLLYKAADTIAEWRTAELDTNSQDSLVMAAMKMVTSTEIIDAEIEQWLAERAPIWEEDIKECQKEQLPGWLKPLYDLPGAPSQMRLASNLLIAQRYNLTRGTRIQLYAHTLNAIDVLIASAKDDNDLELWLETQLRCELRVMQLIEEVLCSIYGHMTLPIRGKPAQKEVEDVPTLRVFMLLWPLYKVSMMLARRESLQQRDTQGRRFWARSILCWCRDEMGVKKCEAFVDNIDGKFGLTFS
ncbi:uncharacterized protein PV09_03124 [Verruconis gallopava]|uniref:Zn(2)-C6 fungal-type domain-containing protein n=1 Tax=Verruconis gallopava TaxID=253628 RepID=A0A0D1XT91_9PEZI|nr:uncharacterized protein PV09_03124 [Verruconis gallopava]KIW05931.1 hypothetical protein PV09_03124 [Verruconis gallopava]